MWGEYLRRRSEQCACNSLKVTDMHGEAGSDIFYPKIGEKKEKKCALRTESGRQGGVEGSSGRGWSSALSSQSKLGYNHAQALCCRCLLIPTHRNLLQPQSTSLSGHLTFYSVSLPSHLIIHSQQLQQNLVRKKLTISQVAADGPGKVHRKPAEETPMPSKWPLSLPC